MPHSRPRRLPYPAAGANTPATIPDAQRQALDRRHALNEQQRGFNSSIPSPHVPRPRPPG